MSAIDFAKKHKIAVIVVSVIGGILLLGVMAQVAITAIYSSVSSVPKMTQTKEVRDTTKQITEETEIPFKTTRMGSNTINKGVEKTTREGKNGVRKTTYKVTINSSGKETKREMVREEVTVEPIDKIISVGTYVAPVVPTATTPSAYYANCTAAKNAGVAPIYRGQAGYRSALDRDHDGVACE